jgi:hypothetical protein
VESARTEAAQNQLFAIRRGQRDLHLATGNDVEGRPRIAAQVDHFVFGVRARPHQAGQADELGGRQVGEKPNLGQQLRFSASR